MQNRQMLCMCSEEIDRMISEGGMNTGDISLTKPEEHPGGKEKAETWKMECDCRSGIDRMINEGAASGF